MRTNHPSQPRVIFLKQAAMPPNPPNRPKRLLTTSLTYEPSGQVIAQSTVHATNEMVTESTERIPTLTQPQPSSAMTTSARPITFSGNRGERVKYFLVMCKLKWMLPYLSEKDINDGQVAEVIFGVRGAAEQFVQILGTETVSSFALLSDALTRRFPYIPPYRERRDIVMCEAMQMSQGNKTLEEYAEEGKRFCQRLSFKESFTVSVWWITGLSNCPPEVIRDWQQRILDSYLEEDLAITFEEVVTMVTEYQRSQRLTCHQLIGDHY